LSVPDISHAGIDTKRRSSDEANMATEAENDRDDTQQHEQPEETQQSAPKASAASGELRCSVCGGLAKRTWSDVSLLNLVTFIIFLALAPFAFFACVSGGLALLGIASLLCVGIALISFWALPVTGAIAVAAQPRCRHCAQRFWWESDEISAGRENRFPLRFALIGGAILLVSLVAGLVWLKTAPGLETWNGGLRFISRIVMAGLALGLGWLGQAIIWRKLHTRMTIAARRSLLLLPAVVLGAGWLALTGYDHRALSRKYDPVARSPEVLDRAGLAALPPSARAVRVHSWAFMLSGQFDLRFAAEPNAIERFLAASPSLKSVTCQTYSRQKMLLRGGTYVSPFDGLDASGNEVLPSEADMPRWYQQEIRGLGRRYEISWHDGMYQGELLVDDQTHTVYVHVDRF
jgi:hypothetical protein